MATPAPAVVLPIAASGIDVGIGGLFQADYRYYMESERADNRFMIRRAQVELTSQIRPWLKVNLEYEFKNNTIDHLQDTFAEISFGSHAARIGHFKKPFGLEQQSQDAGICFAERSMGDYLSPGRDVGLMLHGAFSKNRLHYAAGLFNADGDNVGNRSDGRDDPELAGTKLDHCALCHSGGCTMFTAICPAKVTSTLRQAISITRKRMWP